MNTDNHSKGFRPSKFGYLDSCIHYESGEAGEAAARGTKIHAEIAESMRKNAETFTPESKWASELVCEYLNQGWRIYAVEQPVDILDEFGEKITHGTIDLVLERNGDYLIRDWKTGDKGKHDLQIHGYGAAWMDLHPEAKNVQGFLDYVDLQESVPVFLSYVISATNVLLLYDKWKEKERHPYVIGTQCDWCALRAACPAWAEAATTAFDKVNYLTLNPATGLPQGGNLVPSAVAGLKNDPERLEEFVLAWERAKTLVETDWGLKDALKTHIQTGFKAEHYILVNVKDSSKVVKTVNAEEFLEKVAHKIGYMQAARAVVVEPDIALEVWRNFYHYGYEEDAKFPVEIKETIVEKPGYSYIRVKGKPGAGDARKKRKELE